MMQRLSRYCDERNDAAIPFFVLLSSWTSYNFFSECDFCVNLIAFLNRRGIIMNFRNSLLVAFVAIVPVLILSCGGSGGGASTITGPTLSMSEAKELVIDQLYINGGMADEYSKKGGEFSVYLRDAATGKNFACTTLNDGMNKLAIPGMYYANLSVPFKELDVAHPSEVVKFKLIFVEQDSKGCPDDIDESDDIVGISDDVMLDDIIDRNIWATNGHATTVLELKGSDHKNVEDMAPSTEDGLYVDELNFKDEKDALGYYLFVDGEGVAGKKYQCQIDDAYMDNIVNGDILYAALGYPVPCILSTDSQFDSIKVKFELYAQKEDGVHLIGDTDPKRVDEAIGSTIQFKDGKGSISLRSVETEPFKAAVFRLEELTGLKVDTLSYKLSSSVKPNLELELMDENKKYVIACTGADQGFTDVDSPDDYFGLNASFVAVEEQKELFGWNKVVLRLVDRSDGLRCPKTLESEPDVLGTSDAVDPDSILSGTILFQNGAGSVGLSR